MGERLATTEEYNETLNKAKRLNPKYPRVEFLPLDRNETVQLQDGLFKVGEDLQLIPLPCPKN
jgi:hypothetical protein